MSTFKKAVRAGKKVSREIDKVQRAEAKRQRSVEKFAEKLEKEPIQTLNVTYDPALGLTSDTVEIQTPSAPIEFAIEKKGDACSFTPKLFDAEGVIVEPLDLIYFNFATFLPIRVSNFREDFTPNINWVKKTNPSSSSVFLLDVEHSEYYYPIETDITGSVVANHPRAGIIAFEPFRKPTGQVELHLVNTRLGPPGGDYSRATTKFVVEDPDLHSGLKKTLEAPEMASQVNEFYE